MILIPYGPKLGQGKVKLILLTTSDYEKFNELRQNARTQLLRRNGGIMGKEHSRINDVLFCSSGFLPLFHS